MEAIVSPKVMEGFRQRFALEGVMRKIDPKFKKWFQYTIFTATHDAKASVIQAELEKLQRVIVIGDKKTHARISEINLKTENQRLILFMPRDRSGEGFPGVAYEGGVRIDGDKVLVAQNEMEVMEHFDAVNEAPTRDREPSEQKSKRQKTK